MSKPFLTLALLAVFCAQAFLGSSQDSECQHSLQMFRDVEYGNFNPNNRSSTSQTIRAKAGTSGGSIADTRSIFEFDLSSFDSTQTIDSAFLSLYSAVSSSGNTHGTEDGSNESYLRRVIDAWDETTVSWNNEPAFTTINEYFMPMTTSSSEDREDMDVTALVQDMVANPSNSHGFHFQLATESYYRRMIFGSSDNVDSTLHPKLVVYSCPVISGSRKVETEAETEAYFENSGKLNIGLKSVTDAEVSVYNEMGQRMATQRIQSNTVGIANQWPAGIYFIQIIGSTQQTESLTLVKPMSN